MKMKKITALVCVIITTVCLLAGCGNTSQTLAPEETETPAATATPVPTPTPVPTVPPNAEVSDVSAICSSAGITTGAQGQHGGHQTRICHTEHGTYITFVSYDSAGKYYFYVVKQDENNNTSIVLEDWCPYDAALVNVAADTNGDVYVTAFPINKLDGGTIPETAWLALYRIDAATDKVTEYKKQQQLNAISANGFGYSQPIFDFENRKIYAMYNGGNKPGLLSWFTFDMNTMKWLDTNYTVETNILRHAYMYCFPDGNGGVVIVANRDIPTDLVALECKNGKPKFADYVWDQLDMIIIPDLTKASYSSIVIHEADYSRGSEGIAPNVSNNQLGDAFVDANGRLHILYTVKMVNYNLNNGHKDGLVSKETRHAIYEGTTCIYNETIEFDITDWNDLKWMDYSMRMVQSTTGHIYIFAVPLNDSYSPKQIEVYRATDELGTQFVLESITELEGVEHTITSFSVSCPRSDSKNYNTVDCMVFGSGKEIYTFNVTIY